MNLIELAKELAANQAIQFVLGLLGTGSLFFLFDRLGVQVVKLLFRHEGVILKAIDWIDENYIDTLEKDMKKTHNAVQGRLLSLCDKIKAKIQD